MDRTARTCRRVSSPHMSPYVRQIWNTVAPWSSGVMWSGLGEILYGVHSPLDHGPQFTQLLPQKGIWLCTLVTCGATEAEVDNTANDAAAVWRASLRDATRADPSKPWNSGQHL